MTPPYMVIRVTCSLYELATLPPTLYPQTQAVVILRRKGLIIEERGGSVWFPGTITREPDVGGLRVTYTQTIPREL